jgi:hypothetical protein
MRRSNAHTGDTRQISFHSSSLTAPTDSIVRQPVAAMRLSWCSDNRRIWENEWQILNDFVKASSLVTPWFRRLACVGALWIPASPFASPIKQLPFRELRRPGRSSSVLRLAIRTLERNMPLARRGFMFTTARESDCLRFT